MPVAAAGRQQRRKKKACEPEFAPAIEAEIAQLVAPGAADQLDFEAFETHLRRQALQLAARAVERRLNADHSDHTGPTAACACGQRARYAGRHAKTFEASLGPLTLERAYYHCGHCGGGFFPRDMALGMARTSLSPAVTRMTAAAAARVSFAQAGQLLAELAGVQVGAKRVERTAEALGCEIAAAERREVFAPEEPSASTMYLGADGTGVPMRPHEVAGRAGKQSDGSARTREGKVIVLWTAEGRDEHDHAVRDAGSVTYSAAIDSAAWRDTDPLPPAFVRRLRREAERRGFDRAQRKVIMGDGAKWIWSVATELYPSAIQIVDFFHACEKVWEVAKALFPGDRDSREHWADARCAELQAGPLEGLLATLRAHAGSCEAAAKCVGYIETNRERMRYPEFRAQGLHIGSGVVEGACKSVVGGRLKQGGMRWTKDGADAVMALRSCILSGRYEDFWEWRSKAPSKAAA